MTDAKPTAAKFRLVSTGFFSNRYTAVQLITFSITWTSVIVRTEYQNASETLKLQSGYSARENVDGREISAFCGSSEYEVAANEYEWAWEKLKSEPSAIPMVT